MSEIIRTIMSDLQNVLCKYKVEPSQECLHAVLNLALSERKVDAIKMLRSSVSTPDDKVREAAIVLKNSGYTVDERAVLACTFMGLKDAKDAVELLSACAMLIGRDRTIADLLRLGYTV